MDKIIKNPPKKFKCPMYLFVFGGRGVLSNLWFFVKSKKLGKKGKNITWTNICAM